MSAPTPKKSQRVRGTSFKQEYTSAAAPSAFQKMKAKITGARTRQPSMVHDAGKMLIPPKEPSMAPRITVVLDLDETLVYAREGPLYARPGVEDLLVLLKKRFEAVVWTAGVKAYAQAVVRNIDKDNAIQHTVYRHKKWFSGCAGYNKDLTLLGRDLNTTLILENTPDCVRGNEKNGILVADYEGGEMADSTLPGIALLLEDLADKFESEGMTVPQYITSSKYLSKQVVPTDLGDRMVCYCLDINNMDMFKAQKEKRQNRDLPARK
jgi:carboxy-terminal domain RNA polymerase II polypeptide A small phosphatase